MDTAAIKAEANAKYIDFSLFTGATCTLCMIWLSVLIALDCSKVVLDIPCLAGTA